MTLGHTLGPALFADDGGASFRDGTELKPLQGVVAVRRVDSGRAGSSSRPGPGGLWGQVSRYRKER